jgi:hypothetical protein
MGWTTEGSEFKSRYGQEFSPLYIVQTVSGSTQPPIQWVQRALSLRVKQLVREADHSPPGSAEVKKMWIYTFPLHMPSWRSA